MNEDIDNNLKDVIDHFEQLCYNLSCDFEVTTDESNLQRLILPDRSLAHTIYDDLTKFAERNQVHVELDLNHKGGALFSLSPVAMNDDHWVLKPKNAKRKDYSPFVNKKDSDTVKNGKSLPDRGHGPRSIKNLADEYKSVTEAIDSELYEDQYKSPTGKHRRSQSAHPSSFSKSKSFGGVSNEKKKIKEAIAGSSIPVQKEPDPVGKVGVAQGQRTTGSGENQKVKSYKDRKNNSPSHEKSISDVIDAILDMDEINERQVAGTRIGRTNDKSKRSLTTKRVVPNKDENQGATDGPEDVIGNELSAKIDRDLENEIGHGSNVVPDFDRDTEEKPNMRPLGVFGPQDNRQPNGGPVSNVVTKHPRDRSFDNNSPEIRKSSELNKVMRKYQDNDNSNYRLPTGSDNSDPLNKSDGTTDGAAEIQPVREGIVRPEDGYEFMQLLVKDLGLVTEPRKIVVKDRTYVKACDGEIRLEYDFPDDPSRHGNLTVYRRGKKIKEISVDLSKNTVVDEVSEEILNVNA